MAAHKSDHVIMQGYLSKMKRTQNKILPQWNKRYFMLQEGELRWYRREGSERPSGRIKLTSIKTIDLFESGKEGAFSFVVRAEERNIYLRAKSQSKLNYWRNGLNLQLDLMSGGTAQGPKCAKNQKKVIKGGALEARTDELMKGLDALLENNQGSTNGSSSNTFASGGLIPAKAPPLSKRMQGKSTNQSRHGEADDDVESDLRRGGDGRGMTRQTSGALPRAQDLVLNDTAVAAAAADTVSMGEGAHWEEHPSLRRDSKGGSGRRRSVGPPAGQRPPPPTSDALGNNTQGGSSERSGGASMAFASPHRAASEFRENERGREGGGAAQRRTPGRREMAGPMHVDDGESPDQEDDEYEHHGGWGAQSPHGVATPSAFMSRHQSREEGFNSTPSRQGRHRDQAQEPGHDMATRIGSAGVDRPAWTSGPGSSGERRAPPSDGPTSAW